MRQFRIAGVPERFFDAIKDQLIMCRGGTGEMIEKLNNKDLDIAIGLTEGFVKNGKFPIIGQYTINPITWMICGKSAVNIKTLGISRFGSGSELMGHLLAERENLSFNFKECFHLEGLLESMRNGNIDAFLWEHFTTLPHVQPREIAGSIDSPWPAFCIACRPEILEHKEDLKRLLNEWTVKNHAFLKANKTKTEFLKIEYPKNHSLLNVKALDECNGILKGLKLVSLDHTFRTAQL